MMTLVKQHYALNRKVDRSFTVGMLELYMDLYCFSPLCHIRNKADLVKNISQTP